MKMNKKLILLIILVLIMGISVGCSKTPKAPEGVSQEFYDDMIFILNDLSKTITNTKVKDSLLDVFLNSEGIKKVGEYKRSVDELSLKESSIIENISNLYVYLEMYYNGISEEDVIEDSVNAISDLLEINIDLKDYVF